MLKVVYVHHNWSGLVARHFFFLQSFFTILTILVLLYQTKKGKRCAHIYLILPYLLIVLEYFLNHYLFVISDPLIQKMFCFANFN